jgi:putative glutamine amidotransferase
MVLAAIDGLVLAGGGDIDPAQYGAVAEPEVAGVDPERDAWELALVREAELPILGVCRGAQVINVARGGTLIQDLPARTTADHRVIDRPDDEVHVVELTEGSRVREAVGVDQLVANTLHHQSVDQLGAGLCIVGWADDGTVEAIEADDGPLIGIQWHPELLRDRLPHLRLFEWLVQTAGAAEAAGELGQPD